MRIHRLLSVCGLMSVVSVSACAGRYRTEHVGQGTAIIQPRDAARAPAVGGGLQLPKGTYKLALAFDVPRAQVIDWTLTCPGVQVTGTTGEAFEQYRARRLAELRRQRERDRQTASAVTSTLVGAIAPSVAARGEASTPNGHAVIHAEGEVPAELAGDAVANAMVDDVVALAPGDVGAGRLASTVRIETIDAGVCAVTATADDAAVVGTFEVMRVRDLHAEAQLQARTQRTVAITARTALQARLVAHGADPALRQRQRAEADARALQARLEVEARARAQARIRLEAQARIDAQAQAEALVRVREQARLRAIAMSARVALRGRCVAHGAEPFRRERIAAERDAARVRARAEATLRLEAQVDAAVAARAELRGRLVQRGADPGHRARIAAQLTVQPAAPTVVRTARVVEHHPVVDTLQLRLDLAERARFALRARWVAWGAVPRPPRPALLAEHPGDPPFAGARWEAGTWVWLDGRWQWRPGGWTDPDVFTATGGDVMVGYDSGVELDLDVPPVRTPRETIIDHRDDAPSTPTVRDHRSRHDSVPTSTVRDHRDDKRDEKDDDRDRDRDRGGTVRDHRRR